MYEYLARIDDSKYPQGAYDGDTIDLIIDLGFKMTTCQRIRLLDVNTPELRGYTKEDGLAWRDVTRDWLKQTKKPDDTVEYDLIVRTHKSDSFGRYLAIIQHRFPDPFNVNEVLNTYLLEKGCPRYES
jgi:micrococcal nuclease